MLTCSYLVTLAPGLAHADAKFFRLRSAVVTSDNWCINVPGAEYKTGVKLAFWRCLAQNNLVFGFGSDSNLTIGGLCVDGLAAAPGNARERDPVALAECDGKDTQVWQMRRVPGFGDRVEIANADGLCIAVGAPAPALRVPLVLSACDKSSLQAFMLDPAARPVAIDGKEGYGAFGEGEFYWRGGKRYCWYGEGPRNAGWYVCGANQQRDIEWGGPAGWNFWHHHGHVVAERKVRGSFVGGGPDKAPSHPPAADFQIVSDQLSTTTGARLCLAVDVKRPVVSDPGVKVTTGVEGAAPLSISGTFFPVVVTECDRPGENLQTKWNATDTREFRTVVNGKAMCLSSRLPASFEPLIDSYLKAFRVSEPNSPFVYLEKALKPGGADERLKFSPQLVVNDCGRADATDFWAYDKTNGLVTGTTRNNYCVTIHGDPLAKPARFEAGMPVRAESCSDVRNYFRWDVRPAMRWTLGSGDETAPNYFPPDPADYFSGVEGLPIVGPMGRCLTADFPLKIAVTSDCDSRVEQNWKRDGRMLRLGNQSDCLTRNADGTVGLGACANAANQQWIYTVKEPTPGPTWYNIADLHAQFHPADAAGSCLVVNADPFADTMLQRNRVKVAPCTSVRPRQTSWFHATTVRTMRLALLRYADDDGSNISQGRETEEQSKRMMEEVARQLSLYYRVLGLRFVFHPDHDFVRANDSIANQAKWYGDNSAEGGSRIARIASTTLYGKATIATMNGYIGGGSSGGYVEFEIERMRDIYTGKPETNYFLVKHIPTAKDGLPAVSYSLNLRGVSAALGSVGVIAHEFGHYFSLGHTFNALHNADTPDDARDGKAWEALGTNGCGNPRTVTVSGKKITNDRINNEGYFRCTMGRAHPSFSPMQLATMNWMIDHQLNRYPMVACQPVRAYDANQVECENAESLALCQQTADYLKRRGDPSLRCGRGGRFTRAVAEALQFPAVLHLLNNTPPGRKLMNRLAGLPAKDALPPPAAQNSVIEALKDVRNIPLTMALVTRLREFRQQASGNPSLAKGFVANGAAPSAADAKAITSLSEKIFTAGFIDKVPKITAP